MHLFELHVNVSAANIVERPAARDIPATGRDLGTCRRLLQLSYHSALTI
ncbi:MAG: hypothetical protein KA063_03890 [Firmicutes bacterium]|nr:hypothetical protein [Bacillota bacterium]